MHRKSPSVLCVAILDVSRRWMPGQLCLLDPVDELQNEHFHYYLHWVLPLQSLSRDKLIRFTCYVLLSEEVKSCETLIRLSREISLGGIAISFDKTPNIKIHLELFGMQKGRQCIKYF